MFSCLFGWRHASKCKKLVRRLQCRIKLLKSKRSAIVRQLREDVAQLIKTGYREIAIDRAELLIKDKNIVELYESLDHFGEFVVLNMPYIRSHKDCPNDISEAVSSLIFASARCGDLPELIKIRKLFVERYGDTFAVSSLELHSGNLVNLQIIEKLSMKSITDDEKRRMVAQIASDYCLQPEILAFEFASEIDKQRKLDCLPHTNDDTSPRIDDVEEVRASPQPKIDKQDKSLFKFKDSPTKGVNLSFKKECSYEKVCFLEDKKPVLDHKQDQEHVSGLSVYNVFTYPDCAPSKRNMEEIESCGSDCSSGEGDDLPLPPYNRAMSMPSGWLRRTETKTRRSNSCPCQYPNHVHPKLPDCDEIAAKFSALKKEYTQTVT